MAKSFKNLREKMTPERRERVEARARETLREINLRELRQAFALTQQQLAATLKINQAAISKMESQSDMYVSTLRRILEAMGAHLKIVAEFPDGEVVISQFTQKDHEEEARI
jgi:transcriptional regulator with XRE-family HTH domain